MGFIPENQNDTNKATASTNSGGSSSLRTLNDCKINAPLSGQSLLYNGNLWQNYNLNLSFLSDVVIQELADGEEYSPMTKLLQNGSIKHLLPVIYQLCQIALSQNQYLIRLH